MTTRRFFKWEQVTAELGSNSDANITCNNIFSKIIWHIFFMLLKEYVFVLGSLPLLHKLKKEDDPTSVSYLHILNLCQDLLSQTK